MTPWMWRELVGGASGGMWNEIGRKQGAHNKTFGWWYGWGVEGEKQACEVKGEA